MKKLLLLLAVTLGGCMTPDQAEKRARDIGLALCSAPNLPVRATAVASTGDGGTIIVAVTCGARPPVLMECRDWRCRVADAQLPTQPSVDKETK